MTADEGLAVPGLWEYAGELYGRKGVEPLLLRLQDEQGADVLLLITACWVHFHKAALEARQWQSVAAWLAPWREQVIEPLRDARRYVRQESGRSQLYDQIKAAELSAEREQLERLSQRLQGEVGVCAEGGLLRGLIDCCVSQGIEFNERLEADLKSLAQLAEA